MTWLLLPWIYCKPPEGASDDWPERISSNTLKHAASQHCLTCFTTTKQIISVLAVRSLFLLFISLHYTWYVPPDHPHPPSPSQWPCPLSRFRLMTSDSPLRGASCLQSAVRLLVIIFQSVTLVSASWLRERSEGPGWQDGWGGEWGERKGCDVWWWAALYICV